MTSWTGSSPRPAESPVTGSVIGLSRRRIRLLLSFNLIFLVSLADCNDRSVGPEDFNGLTMAQADSMTLASLRRINDYPFYMMRYYGEYSLPAAHDLEGGTAAAPEAVEIGAGGFYACTCFAVLGSDTTRLLGRNFDWYDHVPLLLYTDPPDGYASVSMVDLSYFGYHSGYLPDDPENRLGLMGTPLLPFDGLNEAGLAVGMMAVPYAESPQVPGRPTVDEIEIIRVALDGAGDVEEAIELFGRYNIVMTDPPIHYMLADSGGNSAIIEFVGYEMIVMRNTEPWQVSTNFVITGSNAPGTTDCWRYNTAYGALSAAGGHLSPGSAMQLLEEVSQPHTLWSLVYGLDSGEIRVAVGSQFQTVEVFGLDTIFK